MRLVSILESLIFAAEKPLTAKLLRQLTGASAKDLSQALEELQSMYRAPSGIELVEIAGGFQFRTAPANANWVRKLLAGRPARLTRPMLETLAIIAYRQPVTRPEIEDIRGVDCGGTLRVLLERNLIRIVGKKEEPGRPLLYGTAKFFLEFFQLGSLKELPTLKEFAELSEEHSRQVDQQFGEGEPTIIEQDAESGVGQDVSGDLPDGTPPMDSQQLVGDEVAVEPALAESSASPAPPVAGFEEDEDAALVALDRALEHADVTLRANATFFPKPGRPQPASAGEQAAPDPEQSEPATEAFEPEPDGADTTDEPDHEDFESEDPESEDPESEDPESEDPESEDPDPEPEAEVLVVPEPEDLEPAGVAQDGQPSGDDSDER